MRVNYAIILAAGFGSRMGLLGKSVPKVLWPIMNKKILGLQIEQLYSENIKEIYVNIHYLANEINSYLKENYPDVKILHEQEILGSGGAIHNFARQSNINYKGRLLIVNGDQFFMIDKISYDNFIKDDEFNVRLLSLNVDNRSKYNGFIIENNYLKSINPPSSFKNPYVTFSGISLVNLETLKPVVGVSSFFESVANYKEVKVEVINSVEQEYWDFGTRELYIKNILKLKKGYSDEGELGFVNFCKKANVVIDENIFNSDGSINMISNNKKVVI